VGDEATGEGIEAPAREDEVRERNRGVEVLKSRRRAARRARVHLPVLGFWRERVGWPCWAGEREREGVS
jgi:hypothetical protein